MKGHSLISEVFQELERIVNRVAKSEIGEKVILVDQLDGGVVKLKRNYVEAAVKQESNQWLK